MIDSKELAVAADAWIAALNAGELETMMAYYDDNVVLYSPAVTRRWELETGKLEGKRAVEKHFRRAFEEMPAMRLQLQQMLFGVESVLLVYLREDGTPAADVVFFNEAGKVKEVRAYYKQG